MVLLYISSLSAVHLVHAEELMAHRQVLQVLASNTAAQSGLIQLLAKSFESKNLTSKL